MAPDCAPGGVWRRELSLAAPPPRGRRKPQSAGPRRCHKKNKAGLQPGIAQKASALAPSCSSRVARLSGLSGSPQRRPRTGSLARRSDGPNCRPDGSVPTRPAHWLPDSPLGRPGLPIGLNHPEGARALVPSRAAPAARFPERPESSPKRPAHWRPDAPLRRPGLPNGRVRPKGARALVHLRAGQSALAIPERQESPPKNTRGGSFMRRSGGPDFRPAGFAPKRPAHWCPHAPVGRAAAARGTTAPHGWRCWARF